MYMEGNFAHQNIGMAAQKKRMSVSWDQSQVPGQNALLSQRIRLDEPVDLQASLLLEVVVKLPIRHENCEAWPNKSAKDIHHARLY